MRIKVRDFEMAYDDTGGKGVPLVLLHGFPLDRTIWSAQLTGLADAARVIAPDLRGFGESPNPGGSMTMDDYATDVCGLLDALHIDTAVIGGVSMGGYVAMAFQRKFARRVCGLLFVDTRADADSPDARTARDKAIALARAERAPAIAAQMIGKMLTLETARTNEPMRRRLLSLMSAQSVEGVVAALAAIRDRYSSLTSNAKITVPVLVVTGAEDTLIAPKESEALHAAIAGARLAIVRGAGHLPNYEKPEAFNLVVREWLAAFPVQHVATISRV